MATVIDGKLVSLKMREQIRAEVAEMKANGITPGLAVIIVGDDPASQIYVRNKGKACAETGIYSEIIALDKSTTQAGLTDIIKELNSRNDIDGILVQLPLPPHIDPKEVIKAIDPEKDVDAFTDTNVGKIVVGDYRLAPCTPAGVMELLRSYDISPRGKNCVIIGRSNIVGKPLALLMLHADATVTVCHTKTVDIKDICARADIIVSSVGKAGFIQPDMVKDGAVVIDVGINRKADGKVIGDVDYEGVSKKASYITPVPGGVGPMTITMLLKNTLTAAKTRKR